MRRITNPILTLAHDAHYIQGIAMRPLFAAVLVIAAAHLQGVVSAAADNRSADLVVTGARIYTATPEHTYAQALAVRDGRIVFVGSNSEAADWIGPQTKTESLH